LLQRPFFTGALNRSIFPVRTDRITGPCSN